MERRWDTDHRGAWVRPCAATGQFQLKNIYIFLKIHHFCQKEQLKLENFIFHWNKNAAELLHRGPAPRTPLVGQPVALAAAPILQVDPCRETLVSHAAAGAVAGLTSRTSVQLHPAVSRACEKPWSKGRRTPGLTTHPRCIPRAPAPGGSWQGS